MSGSNGCIRNMNKSCLFRNGCSRAAIAAAATATTASATMASSLPNTLLQLQRPPTLPLPREKFRTNSTKTLFSTTTKQTTTQTARTMLDMAIQQKHQQQQIQRHYFSTRSISSNSNSNHINDNSNENEQGVPPKPPPTAVLPEHIVELRNELLRKDKNNNDDFAAEFVTNKYEVERHGHGESYHEIASPDIIICPKNVSQIVTIVNYCRNKRIPIIPFGAGTSVEGHVHALYGGVSLDMKYFNDIQLPNNNDDDDEEEEYLPDPLATVGAGVSRVQLNESSRHTGYQFVVDPGAEGATIGGMVATNASGTTTMRYGTMRDNIYKLTAVLPNGTVVTVGSTTEKNSAGYDLLSLLCGSEGTLGIITSITVKLHPVPEHTIAAICAFDSIGHAARAVATLKLCGEVPLLTRCELLDTNSVVAFNIYNTNNNNQNNNNNDYYYEPKPTLFLDFQGSGSEASLKEQVQMTQDICTSSEYNGSNFKFTSCELERKQLWSARHQLYYASIALRNNTNNNHTNSHSSSSSNNNNNNLIKSSTSFSNTNNDSSSSPDRLVTAVPAKAIVTDVCVPLSQLATVMDQTRIDIETNQILATCFGHAGDGNFHCILPFKKNPRLDDNDNNNNHDNIDYDSEEYISKIHTVHDNLIRRALRVGGTCTGEHGIGYGKIKYLHQQYDSNTVDMMKGIKLAIDPYNIMNPGKIIEILDPE